MIHVNPRGGTEILLAYLHKYVPAETLDKINLITSVCDPALLSKTKPNVLWQHVNTDQRVAQGLSDPNFVAALDKIVFVSNWQRHKFHITYPMPLSKSTVLLNAIEPIEFVDKNRNGRLKLIYTSTPWRGLDVLIESFRTLNRDDIELDVYSSTVIYGSNFMKDDFKWLYDRCRATKNVNYRGYATNKAVRRAVQGAHIFAYPSTFEETSCLAAIEAGAAGCKLTLTNLGALPETCGGHASYTEFLPEKMQLVENYAKLLNSKIDQFWDKYDEREEQSKVFNEMYSWHTRATEWITLIDSLTSN